MTNVLKELAFEARQLKAQEKEAEKTPENIPAPPKNEYTLTVAEYPDIVITKTMARGTKSLILMVSAGAAFIKAEINGREPVSEALNEDNYRNFSSGMPDIALPADFWAEKITRKIICGRALIRLFGNDTRLEMIRKRAFAGIKYPLQCEEWSYRVPDFFNCIDAYNRVPVLYMDMLGRQKPFSLILNESSFVEKLQELFGIDGARHFLEEYERSIVDFTLTSSGNRGIYAYGSREYFRNTIPDIAFKQDSFIDYVLYSSCRMGYAFDLAGFFHDWRDTLLMQQQVYGKIKDKYPKALPMAHKQLSQKVAMMKAEIDEKNFAVQTERAKKYEGVYRGFAFVAPKCRQDFYDEAIAQASCIAGYVNRFTDGECLILFMRDKKTPETSYITVEIIDGEVAQAKLAANAAISEKEEAILTEWVDICNKNAVRGEQNGLPA